MRVHGEKPSRRSFLIVFSLNKIILNFFFRYLTLLLLVMSLAGLTGNIMVIIAICLVKKLKSNTNIILSSLATADMLVCVLVMPPALIQLVTGMRVT